MQVAINGTNVPVLSLLSEDTVEFALGSRIFKEWAAGLDPRFAVTAIAVQDVDFKGRPTVENVTFVKLAVTATKPFDEIVVLRGGTVGILFVLRCEGERHVILVKQQRIATGDFELVELPAGMFDGSTFTGAAIIEIAQELEIVISAEELVDLTANLLGGVYLSPGLIDEQAKFVAVERDVTREELADIQGKATGLREEGESIVLWVVPLSLAAYVTRDAKVFIALKLYELCLAPWPVVLS